MAVEVAVCGVEMLVLVGTKSVVVGSTVVVETFVVGFSMEDRNS